MNEKRLLDYQHYELPKGLPIKMVIDKERLIGYSYSNRRHFHNHLEIGYCYSGTGYVYIDCIKNRYRNGTFIFIPKNMPHGIDSDKEIISQWEFMYIDIESIVETYGSPYAEKIISAMDIIESKGYVLNEEKNDEMAFYIRKVFEHLKEDKYNRSMTCRSIFLAFLVELCNLQHSNLEVGTPAISKGDSRLQPALIHVEKSYYSEIKISDLSELCHVSESHFRKLFIAIMNESPLEYINKIRIKKACERLCDTDETVLSIAMQTGFSTITTFNRNFRKLLKTTPLKWRKINQERNRGSREEQW